MLITRSEVLHAQLAATGASRGPDGLVLSAGICCVATSNAIAEEPGRSTFVGSIAKQVLLDPTTYAPAIIAYDGTMRDWKTSQPFFRNGFMEKNERFTISGRANDLPLLYADGKKRILADAAANLGMSALNNLTGRVFKRMLTDRYPEHREIVRAASWIERISFGVSMS